MFAVVIVWAAYFFFVFQVINHRIRIADFVTSIIILAVVFLIVVFWTVRHLTKPNKKAQQAAAANAARQAAPAASGSAERASGSLTFRVAGVTFENDDGESRQEILRHLKFGDEPWAKDPDDLDAEIEETVFEGEQAFAVLINGYQVGNVPKTHIKRVAAATANASTCYVSSVRIIGGGRDDNGKKLAYGCEITLEY